MYIYIYNLKACPDTQVRFRRGGWYKHIQIKINKKLIDKEIKEE